MQILDAIGREDIATVYIADLGQGRLVEFVESTQPPLTRDKKWVLIVSILLGCPVRCLMCDAGHSYKGRLSKEEMFLQIDYLIRQRFPDGVVPVEKFKIQFARMGEPALNPAVIDVLDEMPLRYDAPGFIPSVSTIAPCGTDDFFERLLVLKRCRYSGGRFQLQFSIHTTDEELRHKIIPVKKWSFAQIAQYGDSFHENGDQKIGLNFALADGMPVDSEVLLKYFSPEKFLIKITPINPTHRAVQNELRSYVDAYCEMKEYPLIDQLRSSGYEVILSIGETEENSIGSNCGQYVMQHLKAKAAVGQGSYNYWESDYDED
ncbi:radical SAM protein [Dehalococcoidia bacterium]|nr:radical SAM protein [Dehalococcoidia bacterium]